MSPDKIKLLKESFAKVEPISEDAAVLFYKRLFEVAPQVKPLFQGDMRKQGQMLMGAISMVVKNIENPDSIIPAVQRLGVRHNAYGAKPEHYPVVGEALLWTLETGIGPSFTGSHREAWTEAYTLLADIMIQAQHVTPDTQVA